MRNHEISNNIESERPPKYEIIFTHHAERLPSGELFPEGLEHVKQRGREFDEQAETLKRYSSNHPSSRAEEFAARLKEAMESAYKLKVPLIAQTAIGKNWGEI